MPEQVEIESGQKREIASALHSKEQREGRLLRESRRIHFIRAAIVGLAAGVLSVLFRLSLQWVESLRDSVLPALGGWPGLFVLLPVSVLLVVIARLLVVRFSPDAAGSGIPHVKAVLLDLKPIHGVRIILVKFIGGLCALGAGLSLGREGPTVQMGAAVGERIASALKVPKRSQRQLIACGAGAGLAAAFNAPLAGFIFVIEELQREMSPLTYGTAFIAAVASDIVTRMISGQGPDFQVRGYPAPPLSALPLVALTGIVMGLVGVLYNRSLLQSVRKMRALEKRRRWQVVCCIGGLAALLMIFLPLSAGSGRLAASAALSGDLGKDLTILFLVFLFLAKFSFTIASYATGVPGGIFAPLLAIASLGGLCLGRLFASFTPSIAPYPGVFGIIAMSAMFAASVRAPITGIVLILEMTANHEQLFALSVASLCAYLVAEYLREKPVYEALLELDLMSGGETSAKHEEPLLLEATVEPGSAADGKRLKDIGILPGCLVVLVRRAGREIVPMAGMILKPGDEVSLLISSEEDKQNLTTESLSLFRG